MLPPPLRLKGKPSKKQHEAVLAASFMMVAVGPIPNLQMGGPPLLAAHDFLFIIATAILHTWKPYLCP
jgi:hypothetical protein